MAARFRWRWDPVDLVNQRASDGVNPLEHERKSWREISQKVRR